MVDQAYDGQVVRASRQARLSRGTVSTWVAGKMRPNLAGLLQLCHDCNADVGELFSGRFLLSNAEPGLASDDAPAPVDLFPRKYRRRASQEDLPTALEAALRLEPPPSLQEFAARHDISPRCLTQRWPALTAELSGAAAEHRRKLARERHEQAEQVYEANAIALKAQGLPVTPKYLQRASGVVAFSQNQVRVRALAAVVARHSAAAAGPP